ncbi:MAG: type II toxin-antitoxin system VapC family toxin [Sphingomonas sp.]
MKITVDTNVLVRALVEDDAAQSRSAQDELESAELVALAIPALCELVWVLARHYKLPHRDIAAAIRRLLNAENVAADRTAIEAGLIMLDQGGDFADGVIADSGRWLGAETFVSFDKQAVQLLQAQGETARAPG